MTTTYDVGDAVRSGLQRWLSTRLPDGNHLVIQDIAKPASGSSAQTLLIDLADASTGSWERRVVARIETPDPPVYPQQAPPGPGNPAGDVEIALQFQVMQALQRAGGVPLATLIGYESDPALLGQPFFVMDFVGGDVPNENPPYTQAGFFTEMAPQLRSTMLRNGLDVVARIHSLDRSELGLDWLVAPGVTAGTEAQVAIWRKHADIELAGREHPALETAWRLLAEKTPAAAAPTLAWGDARPGNIIWRAGEVAAITDFEAASIAPPQQDLGWWLFFDRTMHEAVGAGRLPGDLTREEQCDYYAASTGLDVSDIRWWQVFAGARYAAIVVRVMNRHVERGVMPADNTVWINNPPVVALAQLLDS